MRDWLPDTNLYGTAAAVPSLVCEVDQGGMLACDASPQGGVVASLAASPTHQRIPMVSPCPCPCPFACVCATCAHMALLFVEFAFGGAVRRRCK